VTPASSTELPDKEITMSEIPVQARDLHLADNLPQHLKAKVVRLPLEIYNQVLGVRTQQNGPENPLAATHPGPVQRAYEFT
jgi:hypothetical protein